MNELHESGGLDRDQLDQLTREQLIERLAQSQSQLVAAHEQLEVQKTTDSLTGLANRDYFFASLSRLCFRAKRFGQMVCMALIDIDGFRHVNEQFGNLAGDLVLTSAADVLRSIVRDYDLLARIGEDEFAVAIDNSELTMAREFGQRIRRAINSNPFCIQDRVIPVTVTVGVATAQASQVADHAEALVRLAIEAVDIAHRKGRDQVHFSDMTAPSPAADPGPAGT